MLKIAVCGSLGRMGQRIISLIIDDPELELAGAVETLGHEKVGKDVGIALGLGTIGLKVTDDLDKVISGADCVIDCSTAAATMDHLRVAAAAQTPIVIGTTGLMPKQVSEIKKTARRIPVVLAPNMSVGMNVMFKLAADMARFMPGYDAEIIEVHHRFKKDAPSGTALRLGEAVAGALGQDLKKDARYSRHGNDVQRRAGEIGIQSVRAGDVVGEHTVMLGGMGERLELTHRATSRDNFARGALVAAKWLADKKTGFYDMQDVLGLKG
ncbi:MAG: 4-hydroxy-tetrahydrodipicolinate reductase [Myxococcota bacterium]